MVSAKGFKLAPPIAGDWRLLSSKHRDLLRDRLLETGYFASKDTPSGAIRALALAFYPGWILCDLPLLAKDSRSQGENVNQTEKGIGRGCHSFLYGPDGFTALDGSAAPIHMHNDFHGVDLGSPEKLMSYFRFFCFFIRGPGGPFEVVDGLTQFLLEPDANGVCHPAAPELPKLKRDVGEEKAELSATIFHGGRLHTSDFTIAATGQVSMGDDTVVAENVQRVPALSFINTLRFIQEAESAAS